MTYDVFLIRITMSFVYSLIIGLERQLRGRAIGLRTNVLVSWNAPYRVDTNKKCIKIMIE